MARWWMFLATIALSSCAATDSNSVIRQIDCDDEVLLTSGSATACWSIVGSYASARDALGAVVASEAAVDELAEWGRVDMETLTCPRRATDDPKFDVDFLCDATVVDLEGVNVGFVIASNMCDSTEWERLAIGEKIEGYSVSFVPTN